MNVVNLAAQVSHVRIVDYLNEKVGLLDLVNKGLEKSPEEKLLQSGENTDPFSKISNGDTPLHIPAKRPLQSGENTHSTEKKDPFSEISEGDTTLHIAARKKNFNLCTRLHNYQLTMSQMEQSTPMAPSDKGESVQQPFANFKPTKSFIMFNDTINNNHVNATTGWLQD
ncbi:uncharacterized protein LOC131056349 [Cryptomeria japonica]|uniref:uncharacterized protein LOC131056349 n=1 Tax=Cryptomeria japonica TaxID=3369 RepID=UPI0027DA2C19|nr:uncharacterized protein LOC131056349 [Cryptomeria japonica]